MKYLIERSKIIIIIIYVALRAWCFLNILALRWGLGASRRFWTLIIINDPLIIINTREARNIDVHTPRSAWAPTERKNVQLTAINVHPSREARNIDVH